VQLEKLGANRDVFLSLGDGGCARPAGATGWYSFVAAPDPGCVPQLLPTKCYSRIEASAPLTGKSGDLSGVLGRNQTWQYAPLIDEPGGDEHTGEMLTLAYRPPSKWPYSDPGSRRVLHFLATYNQGATDLRALGDSACYKPGPLRDVRSSYCNIEIKGGGWAGIHTNLGDSKIDQGGKGTSGVWTKRSMRASATRSRTRRSSSRSSRTTWWKRGPRSAAKTRRSPPTSR
jgi:hypothetical protein